jgi:hypothetical protein
MAGPDDVTYRPIRMIGLLLMVQVIGLVGLGAYEFVHLDWQRIGLDAAPPRQAIEVLAFVLFAPSAILTLLSALSFLLLHSKGWILAALGQGLCLAVCLWLYSQLRPHYVYPIMAYCTLMILYLNSHDVRTRFYPRRERARQGGVA